MGAMTRIVDGLHNKEFVRRERSDNDRRAVRISITPAGRRVAKTTEAVVVRNANHLVEIYTRTETDLLISLLQRLLAHMECIVEEPADMAAAKGRPPAVRRRKSMLAPNPRAKSV